MKLLHVAIRIILAGGAVGATALAVQTSNESALLGVRQQVFCCERLERLDALTGIPISSWSYAGSGVQHHTLEAHRDRLVSINPACCFARRVVVFHPADGQRSETLITGAPLFGGAHSLVSDPVSGTLYLTTDSELYTLDPVSGQATLVAPFTGSPYAWDFVHTAAVDASGNVYAIGTNDGSHRYAVYTLQLATAQLTWIGEILMPTGSGGWFRDIAIPPSGDWWASFYEIGLIPSLRGLWRITPGSWQATQVRYVDPPHEGLAFLAPTQQASYCTAKTNSLGCAPAISGEGFPSPTAASGYVLRASNVRNQSTGSLTFGISGRAVLPFGGGVNCVAPPRQRTTVAFSGGSPTGVADCSGVWQLDFNTWMSQHYTLPAGTTIQAQWLGRDAGFAPPDNWSLSNALEFVVRP